MLDVGSSAIDDEGPLDRVLMYRSPSAPVAKATCSQSTPESLFGTRSLMLSWLALLVSFGEKRIEQRPHCHRAPYLAPQPGPAGTFLQP